MPNGGGVPAQVFISYAHDDAEHVDRVRDFWLFLRANGVDARLDLAAAEEPRDWTLWMGRALRECRFVLVVASPAYKRRAEGQAAPDEGRGVQWEAGLIRNLLYADQQGGRRRVLPVVLPGGDAADVPEWLTPATSTVFRVGSFSVEGAEGLLRLLTGQPLETVPELGPVPVLPPRGSARTEPAVTVRAPLRTEVLIRASVEEGRLRSEVSAAGTVLSSQEAPLPGDAGLVWQALQAGPVVAAERMLGVGRSLARGLFAESGQRRVADLIAGLPAGDWVDVVLAGDGAVLGLPVELVRLTGSDGADLGPLALLGGVTVSRRVAGAAGADPGPLPGPVKVLAAVAAPEGSANVPLDVEAEMQAVLDAVDELSGPGPGRQPAGQVQILEVASRRQITDTLAGEDSFHVLHLSAHGSPTSIELEDEDGDPDVVTTERLLSALRDAGVRLPLIVLSSCHGGSASAHAMAVGLVRAGVSRVIAMQTAVTDDYATALTAALYRQLALHPEQPVAQALARARRQAEDRPTPKDRAVAPEYGVATLFTAGTDGPLVDLSAASQPLRAATVMPSGTTVRELKLGELIGRRPQLRAATAVLRRTPAARDQYGAIAGVQLLGIGGIGKTALAGRVIARLRGDGWTVAVHEGRWNPTAFFTTVAEQLADMPETATVATSLASPAVEETVKAELVGKLLASVPLLLVFDDFEQNLAPGGAGFIDPAFDDLLTGWCEAAERGGILLTCRYPLPGDDRYLVPVPVPPLSPAELRRLFLRLPALRRLPEEDRRLLSRIIGGHPRLIEYVDALLRGRPARLKQVQAKLRDLAARQQVDLRRPRPIGAAIDDALLLGSADILLTELLELLTEQQRALVDQLAVSRAPIDPNDVGYLLDVPEGHRLTAETQADLEKLADLTLLAPGAGILLHPWTAELLTRQSKDRTDTLMLHKKALQMRLRRFEQGRGQYPDLLEVARHLAALGQYNDVAILAQQGVTMLSGSLAVAAFLADVRDLLPTDERGWVRVAKLESEAVRAIGNLTQAHQLITATREQIDNHLAAEPDDMLWQGYLSVALVDMADLASATGNLIAASDHLHQALPHAVDLAAENLENSWWQHRPALIHERLGDVAVAAGDLTAAAEHYRASLAIRERLAAADPANTGWQRDLSVSRERLGDVARAAGDLTAAAEHYRASLAIAERLAAADPANTGWQRDLSISLQQLADLEHSQTGTE